MELTKQKNKTTKTEKIRASNATHTKTNVYIPFFSRTLENDVNIYYSSTAFYLSSFIHFMYILVYFARFMHIFFRWNDFSHYSANEGHSLCLFLKKQKKKYKILFSVRHFDWNSINRNLWRQWLNYRWCVCMIVLTFVNRGARDYVTSAHLRIEFLFTSFSMHINIVHTHAYCHTITNIFCIFERWFLHLSMSSKLLLIWCSDR